MNVLFVDIATYSHPLSHRHGEIHRSRRLASDIVTETVIQVPLSGGKVAFSRGLLLLASFIKAQGCNVSYLHLNRETHESLSQAFQHVDIVCFYVMTPTVNICLQLATQAKHVNSRIRVAFGGPHTATQARPLLDSGVVDFVSYGELSPAILAKTLVDIDSWKDCPGIGFKRISDRSNTVVNEGLSENVRSLAAYPMDYSILPLPLDEYYFNISASQGCAYSCSFCSDGTRELNLRAVDDFMSEVCFLDANLKPGSWVHFFDAIFTVPASRAKLICERLANETKNLSFSCDIKANHLTYDLAQGLREARIRFVSMGFETSDDSTLQINEKKNNFIDCYRTAETLKSAHPSCALKAYWLFGLPGSTPAMAKNDIKQIEQLLEERVVDIVGPKCFVPYPETVFFQRPEAFGLKISSRDWSEYDRFHLPPVCVPQSFTGEQLSDFLIQAEESVLAKYCQRLNINPADLLTLDAIPKRWNGEVYLRIIP